MTRTSLDGVLLVEPPTIFKDYRGIYLETYNEKLYRRHGIGVNFIQDDISISRKNVLRGIHGDDQTWKLVSCLFGSIFLAVVNWNRSSNQYMKWESFRLGETDRFQVLIPPKFGNGHLVLSDRAVFHYKQSSYYNRPRQFTIRWNDSRLKIPWPTKNPILSLRDRAFYQ